MWLVGGDGGSECAAGAVYRLLCVRAGILSSALSLSFDGVGEVSVRVCAAVTGARAGCVASGRTQHRVNILHAHTLQPSLPVILVCLRP